jgi:formylglycine-generating enzyme required for sulfatase activity/S1-C subfamily serine protease
MIPPGSWRRLTDNRPFALGIFALAIVTLLAGCGKQDSATPLVACSACGKSISPRATTCPHCGEPVASSKSGGEADPNKTVELRNSIGMKLVFIPPGEFSMGAATKEVSRNTEETPQHTVRMPNGFYLGCFEVNNAEYSKVVGDRSESDSLSTPPLEPISGVSWIDATEFCRKLSQLPQESEARRKYRLPTEAEWEYACRSGTTSEFAFGDTLSVSNATFRSEDHKPFRPTTVGGHPPNRFGLHDMHGNVWEWCADWFSGTYYMATATESPKGPDSGQLRVVRGGSWRTSAELCRSAFRDGNEPQSRREDYGFRVVCIVDDSSAQTVSVPPGAAPQGPSSLGGSAAASHGRELNVVDVVARIEPSVVRIETHGQRGGSTGSGFLVDDRGTIITNYHVIEDASRARVFFQDGEEISIAGYLNLYPEQDLAVLRLTKVPEKRSPLRISADFPKKGEHVVALGAPFGLSFTPSDGIVSAIRDAKEMAKTLPNLKLRVTWIQTTTPISPGNSGGPLVNTRCEVIGVNTITHRLGQNLNFAVSSKDINEAVKDSRDSSVRALNPQSTSLADMIRQIQETVGD